MRVNVCATGNRLHCASHGTAVFNDRLFLGEVSHGDLMAERDIVQKLNFTCGFAFQRNRTDGGAFLQIHDGDAYVVLGFMQ